MRRRPGVLAAALLLSTAAVAGCSGGPFVRSEMCVSWVSFDTPADAAADTAYVASGRVVERAGTARSFETDASVWLVEVDEWITGDGPDEIEVISTPTTCTAGGTYPDGDPLEEAMGHERVVLFLYDEAGTWRTITPMQGIVPAGDDGGIPTEWPDAE